MILPTRPSPGPVGGLRRCILACLAATASAGGQPLAAPPEPLCAYSVSSRGQPPDLTLAVATTCADTVAALRFADADRPFITSAVGLDGAPAAPTPDGWRTRAGGLRYTLDVARRVREGAPSLDVAMTGDTVLLPLSAWMARPEPASPGALLHVTLPQAPGVAALHALAPVPDGRVPGSGVPGGGGRRFALTAGDLPFAGYSVFSSRAAHVLAVPGPDREALRIAVHVASDRFALPQADLAAWVGYFATLSAAYWQGFPTERLPVAILPGGAGDRVSFGRVRAGGGATLQVVVGRNATLESLYREDWVLTHELLHLAQPSLPRDGRWLMEGMATYIEPQLRHYAGLYSADRVWAEWLSGMPRGAEGLANRGLLRANPYWAGALALLASHVALVREDGEKSMADCLSAGLLTLGSATRRATTGATVAACDQALGRPLLGDFFARHKHAAPFNLTGLWRQLGLRLSNGAVIYAKSPEKRSLRRMILSPPRHFVPPPLPRNVAIRLGIPRG